MSFLPPSGGPEIITFVPGEDAGGETVRINQRITLKPLVPAGGWGCGVGFELAIVLPALLWLYRRRRLC